MITTICSSLYVIYLLIIRFFGVIKQNKKEDYLAGIPEKLELSDITVLIPFRNEAKRIEQLLTCLNASTKFPANIVFINDHSTDDSIKIIAQKNSSLNFNVLSMPDNLNGKKQAIRFGIAAFPSSYYLTLDADIVFASDYFLKLEDLPKVDMLILPVILKANSFFKRFFELDVLLINALNQGIAGLKSPIVASGANLLFKAATFHKVDSIEKHAHINSGDDVFLLNDFKKAGASVALISSMKHAVCTETPQSINEYLQQRLRWFSKTGAVKDRDASILVVFQAVFTGLFFVGIMYYGIQANWNRFVEVIAFKLIIDTLFFWHFFQLQGRLATLILLPFYALIFPFYSILIVVLSSFKTVQWKGRIIKNY
jgi:glycosyltransferase involved in cell wall biosynthesis